MPLGLAVLITLAIMLLFIRGVNAPSSPKEYKNPEHDIIVGGGWTLKSGTDPNQQYVVYQKSTHVLYKTYSGNTRWNFEREDRTGKTPIRSFDSPLIKADVDYMDALMK